METSTQTHTHRPPIVHEYNTTIEWRWGRGDQIDHHILTTLNLSLSLSMAETDTFPAAHCNIHRVISLYTTHTHTHTLQLYAKTQTLDTLDIYIIIYHLHNTHNYVNIYSLHIFATFINGFIARHTHTHTQLETTTRNYEDGRWPLASTPWSHSAAPPKPPNNVFYFSANKLYF